MKKLVFAAVAALVMVSVSNVFAGKATTVNAMTEPTDTTVTTTTSPATEAPADTAKTPATTGNAPADLSTGK